jgi:hypothetical protein
MKYPMYDTYIFSHFLFFQSMYYRKVSLEGIGNKAIQVHIYTDEFLIGYRTKQ